MLLKGVCSILTLLALCAAPAAAGDFADGHPSRLETMPEAVRAGRAALGRLGQTARFLGSEPAAYGTLRQICSTLGHDCLRYLRDRPAIARRGVPDNPAYWAAFEALWDGDAVLHGLEDVRGETLLDYQPLIDAAGLWGVRGLLLDGRIDADALDAQLGAWRRGLRNAAYLRDKMVFTAALALTLPALNVHLAAAGSADDAAAADPAARLAPLTLSELSLRRALQGEYALAKTLLTESPPDARQAMLDALTRRYGYLAWRSESTRSDYWRNGVDGPGRAPLPPPWGEYFMLADFSSSLRHADIALELVRGLAAIYGAAQALDVPDWPAPAGWGWRRSHDIPALCLDPVDLNPSFTDEVSQCMDELQPYGYLR